jgi:cystathionine beta-lyase
VTRLLKAGDELIVGDDIYGGMYRLVTKVSQALHGIRVKFVDVTDPAKLQAAITPATRMVHMETPSNPMMRITDIRATAALLRDRGILLSIDSTMMSPILQRPLQLGADVVVHSATKFFGGHSDVMGGLVCLRDEAHSKKIAFFQNAEGTGLEPFACWLFLRGIKTLALRVEKAQANAMAVAAYLARHPLITKLNYVGLPPDPADEAAVRDYRIHTSQSAGPGCVMSFTTGSTALSRRIIDALRIFKLTVSFGSVNSLCEMPCVLSHASIPGDQREWQARGCADRWRRRACASPRGCDRDAPTHPLTRLLLPCPPTRTPRRLQASWRTTSSGCPWASRTPRTSSTT